MKRKSVCFMLLLGLLLLTGLFGTVYGSREASAAAKGTVTTDGLRVRTGAGTSKKVLTCNGENVTLSKGSAVTIQAEKTVSGVIWYKVSFTYQKKTLTGYVSGDYVKITKTDADTAGATTEKKTTISKNLSIPAKITAAKVNVRKGASTSDSKMTVSGKAVVLKKGASVKIIKEVMNGNQKWYYVSFTYNKVTKKGYIMSDYAKLTLSRKVIANVYGVSSIKLRTGAGTEKSYKKVNGKTLTLKKGAEVLITKETKDSDGAKWYKVDCVYNGTLTRGFLPANHIVLKQVVPIEGKVTTENLRVRTGAGTNYAQLEKNGEKVFLQTGQLLTIKAQSKVGAVTWYKVSFVYKQDTLIGYVSGDYVELLEYTLDLGSSGKENNSLTGDNDSEDSNAENDKNTSSDTAQDGTSDKDNSGNTSGDSADNKENSSSTTTETITDIEAWLTEQGFPESYKDGLRTLYKEHPSWVFKSYQTGLSWDEVIANESKVGLNLISKNKANGWKSYETKAYNYATGEFIPYDGSTWVTASKEAVAYYMDPRNLMTERGIFQFLTLEYQSAYEKVSGVENILANTPLYNTSYTYYDDTQMTDVTMLYSETFMEAAKQSGVSPYHLATRVKQEVVSGSTTLSGSATGEFSGYEGYYNFYNIGATHSTAAGGAIANGLNFAMGNKSSEAAKQTYMLPWNTPYKAIVGGAAYIGSQYINRGQNTIYLQKFNVTANSTYSHQYMANVEAANAEAIKLYNGYANVLDTALVFYIPVYENMPEEKAAVPGTIPSPNNWLKLLTVGEYNLTPAFDASAGSDQVYVLSLEMEDITSVTIEATPVSSKAVVAMELVVNGRTTPLSGGGSAVADLVTGENEIRITVTAENGDVNTYNLTITK